MAERRTIKGRGAVSNASGRFERFRVEADDDGWADSGEPTTRPTTIVRSENTKRIIATNDSPDVPFDRSINPYKGCEHGCVYCFARPSHAYLGLSAGLDFETQIFSKPAAAQRLEHELAQPGYRPDVLALGANTDPYQPVERRLEITRSVLEVLDACEHPVGIVTKSSMVLRDLDILASMAARGLAHVHVSITTLDAELAGRMEPRASSPAQRIKTLQRLSEAGVPCGVLASPMIPALNDAELEAILEAATAAGATSAGYLLLRLPGEVAELFSEWLEANYPAKARHVLALIRDTRGGRLYRSEFGERMRGSGAYARMLETRFDQARRRLGLDRRPPPFDLARFRPRRAPTAQLGLFDKTAARGPVDPPNESE